MFITCFLVTVFLGCCTGGLSLTVATKCDKPTHSMGAIFQNITDGPFEIGYRLYYRCRPGYSLSSRDPFIECLGNGNWTSVSGCRPKRCTTLPDLQFGDVSYPDKGPVFGSRVNFSCHAGYVLVGSSFSECLIAQNGEGQKVDWTYPMPHCVNTYCAPPGNIEGGYFFPFKESYGHREAVTYTCQANIVPLTLVGKKSLVCLDGEWSSTPPECRAITCPSPRIPHGFVAIRPRTRYIPGDHIRVMCLDGFQFQDGSGEAESDCTVSGSWEPPIPTCGPLNAPKDEGEVTTEPASERPPSSSSLFPGDPDYHHTSTSPFPNIITVTTSTVAPSSPPAHTPLNSILVASLTALAVSALLAIGIFCAVGCARR